MNRYRAATAAVMLFCLGNLSWNRAGALDDPEETAPDVAAEAGRADSSPAPADFKVAQSVIGLCQDRLEVLQGRNFQKAVELNARILEQMRQISDDDKRMLVWQKIKGSLREHGTSLGFGKQNGPYTIERIQDELLHGIPDMFKQARPEDPAGWREKGHVYFEDKDYRRAYGEYAGAFKRGDHSPDTLTHYGSSAYYLQDIRTAHRLAAMALQQEPGHRGALALFKLSEGRAPDVELPEIPDEGKSSEAGDPSSRVFLPAAASSLSPEEAVKKARALSQVPVSQAQKSVSLTQEAAAALQVRDFSRAQALAAQAISEDSRNAQAWNHRAIAHNKLGLYDQAVYDASFALGLAPGNAAALQTRSWAFSRMGKYQEALADANHTLEKEPDNGYAFYNRAFAQAGLKETREAVESLKMAAQLDVRFQEVYAQAVRVPQNSDILFLFGDIGFSAPQSASRSSRDHRFSRVVFFSLFGGLLMALGLLHVFSSNWRDHVRSTIRRVLKGTHDAASAEAGIWAQYSLVREIAVGGMGVVYEAVDRTLKRRVAIKKMRHEIRSDPKEYQYFLTEARTVAALHHPHIVDIYSVIEDAGDIYMVFEYVGGKTVAELLKERGRFSWDEAKRVIKDACQAVAYAHQQGVIHRDIKPANMMLNSEGLLKVMDFGVARQAQEVLLKSCQTNTIVGTPPYMAPEQEQGAIRKESDMFALGVCFYEMLSGKLPFAGQGAAMLLNKMNAQYALLSQEVPGLPAGLDAVMARVLAAQPEKRYHAVQEFSKALDALA